MESYVHCGKSVNQLQFLSDISIAVAIGIYAYVLVPCSYLRNCYFIY